MRGLRALQNAVIWSVALWRTDAFAQTVAAPSSSLSNDPTVTTAPPSCDGCRFGAIDSTLLSYPSQVLVTSTFLTVTAIPYVTVIDGSSSTYSTEYVTELTTLTELGNVSTSYAPFTGAPTQNLVWTTHSLTL